MPTSPNNKPIASWSKFAGLASQWAVAMVGLLFLGKYMDKQLPLFDKTPFFVWVLPFAFILFSLIRVIRETKINK